MVNLHGYYTRFIQIVELVLCIESVLCRKSTHTCVANRQRVAVRVERVEGPRFNRTIRVKSRYGFQGLSACCRAVTRARSSLRTISVNSI